MTLTGSQRVRFVALIAAVVIIGGSILASAVMSAAPPDRATLAAIVSDALTTNTETTKLPDGLRPGHINDSDRKALRAQIDARFAKNFAGPAFTNRLNGLLSWADRIAHDPTVPRVKSAKIKSVEIDAPVISGDTATLTGTYDLIEQQAYDTPSGVTATYGGTYTDSFALQLERRGQVWMVTAFSEQPLDFVPDPAMESNLDVDPNPGATKPPVDGVPVPVNPGLTP